MDFTQEVKMLSLSRKAKPKFQPKEVKIKAAYTSIFLHHIDVSRRSTVAVIQIKAISGRWGRASSTTLIPCEEPRNSKLVGIKKEQ